MSKWHALQPLSSKEKKRKLAKGGARPPAIAALPARPVPEKKLATLAPTETVANKFKINPPAATLSQPVLQAEQAASSFGFAPGHKPVTLTSSHD